MLMTKRASGFTIVELLVSVAIGAIIMAGMASVVLSSRGLFVSEQEGSAIQENVRFAIESLARDIRMAGSLGCSVATSSFSNTVDTDLSGLLSLNAIEGYRGGESTFPAAISGDADGVSDALIVRYADPVSAFTASSHSLVSTNFSFAEDHGFVTGDKLVAIDSNCRHVGVFEVTATTATQVSHGAGANCTNVLSYNTSAQADPISCTETSPCASGICGTATPNQFNPGSQIMPFIANAYYIGDSNIVPGVPSLKRRVLTESGSRVEELAQGVQTLDLTFGIDSGGDGVIEQFQEAHEVANWDSVVSVRYDIVFRSLVEVHDQNVEVTINNVPYNDRFLRQLASGTVGIRNRL